jgi:hypothetical protein
LRPEDKEPLHISVVRTRNQRVCGTPWDIREYHQRVRQVRAVYPHDIGFQ